jgi:hypothetical protein
LTGDTTPAGSTMYGARTPNFSISSVRAGDVGMYDCVLTNLCGDVASDAAALRVCRADFNCSGAATIQDIFDFLAAWFAGDPRADFNGVNGIGIQDIFDFLAAWFAGC